MKIEKDNEALRETNEGDVSFSLCNYPALKKRRNPNG